MDILTKPLPDTAFWHGMAEGHRNRKGHLLDGVYVSKDGGELWRVVRTCCGEKVPSE